MNMVLIDQIVRQQEVIEKARMLRELVTEVMNWHADQSSPDYNGCDKNPCMWCSQAKQALEECK